LNEYRECSLGGDTILYIPKAQYYAANQYGVFNDKIYLIGLDDKCKPLDNSKPIIMYKTDFLKKYEPSEFSTTHTNARPEMVCKKKTDYSNVDTPSTSV